MSRVESLDTDLVDYEVAVNLERAKAPDPMIVQSTMNVSSLRSRLFESLVPETASVIAVCVRDEYAGCLRNSPSRGRINHYIGVRCADEEPVEPAYPIFSRWSSPPEQFRASGQSLDVGKFLLSTLYSPPGESD